MTRRDDGYYIQCDVDELSDPGTGISITVRWCWWRVVHMYLVHGRRQYNMLSQNLGGGDNACISGSGSGGWTGGASATCDSPTQ